MTKEPIIEIRKLKKFFPLKKKSIFQKKQRFVRANEDITLTIFKNETFGLVGESGCGKSTLGRVILQLYPPTSGSALYYGVSLLEIKPAYVLKEIEKLSTYQNNARIAFQKSIKIDEKITSVKKALDEYNKNIDFEMLKKDKEEIEEKIKALETNQSNYLEETKQALLNERERYEKIIKEKPEIFIDPNWEEEVKSLLLILTNDNNNVSIKDYIELLHIPHKEVLNKYKEVLRIKKEISNLEVKKAKLGKNILLEKRLSKLIDKSKDYKKEASRQLREGSRTCGDYILEADIKIISELMKKEELLNRDIYNRKKTLNKLLSYDNDVLEFSNYDDVIYEYKRLRKEIVNLPEYSNKQEDLKKLDLQEQDSLNKFIRLRKIEEIKPTLDELESELNLVQKELNGYHHKQILDITERCKDKEYQEKLSKNKEYAINLQKLSKSEMRVLRQKLQMIFQDPYSSLDPRMTVGQAISEAVVEHGLYPKGSKELEDYVVDIMKKCGLDHYMIHRYPHQFSGGQRQRIVIARALALKPEFIVCDESVSALDVSIQSQILNLLQELKEEQNLTYLFISHDLSVIKHISDRIGVMYLGDIVELSESEALYANPYHPYSKALISAIPTTTNSKREQIILEGDIPSNINPPSGCKFRTRCPMARGKCAKEKPELREVEEGRRVACHFYEETKFIE